VSKVSQEVFADIQTSNMFASMATSTALYEQVNVDAQGATELHFFSVHNHGSIVFSCTSQHHQPVCAVLTALQNVTWDQFDLIYVTMFLTNKVSCY